VETCMSIPNRCHFPTWNIKALLPIVSPLSLMYFRMMSVYHHQTLWIRSCHHHAKHDDMVIAWQIRSPAFVWLGTCARERHFTERCYHFTPCSNWFLLRIPVSPQRIISLVYKCHGTNRPLSSAFIVHDTCICHPNYCRHLELNG